MLMLKSHARQHFRDVFQWSGDEESGPADIVIAALGMAVPVLAGLLCQHEAAGFAGALGSLAINRLEPGSSFRAALGQQIKTLGPTCLAAIIALACAGHGHFTLITLVAVAVLAAIIGGFNRKLAIASTRFIIFLMIISALPPLPWHDEVGMLVMIILGMLWTTALGTIWASFIIMRGQPLQTDAKPAAPQSAFAQQLNHWLRSLRNPAGWNYTLRLGACLLIAAILQWIWPTHHLHWISLTIVLLISRRPEPGTVKTTQRTLGTGIGVVLAGLLMRTALPAWAMVVTIFILAGARSHFRQRNYLAYAVVMTPLVILIIDAGQPASWPLLADRLVATIVGGVLVMFADLALKTR